MQVLITEMAQGDIQSLKDRRARAKIRTALERLGMGNPGDAKPVGDGISEIRLHYGPGYRIYYFQEGEVTYIVACAGDKSTQTKDIKRAKTVKENWINS